MTDLPAPAEPLDAYALLTRPTLDLTDAEVDTIIVELRRRRATHIATGKPDKTPVPAKPKATPLTAAAKAEAKKAATADVLASIDWKF